MNFLEKVLFPWQQVADIFRKPKAHRIPDRGTLPRGVDEIPCGWRAAVGSESLPGEELPPSPGRHAAALPA